MTSLQAADVLSLTVIVLLFAALVLVHLVWGVRAFGWRYVLMAYGAAFGLLSLGVLALYLLIQAV